MALLKGRLVFARKTAGASRKESMEFKLRPTQDRLVICHSSHWIWSGEPDMLSFAATTEVAAARNALHEFTSKARLSWVRAVHHRLSQRDSVAALISEV